MSVERPLLTMAHCPYRPHREEKTMAQCPQRHGTVSVEEAWHSVGGLSLPSTSVERPRQREEPTLYIGRAPSPLHLSLPSTSVERPPLSSRQHTSAYVSIGEHRDHGGVSVKGE